MRKTFVFWKSISRTVHHCHDDEREKEKTGDGGDEASTSLTVWTKSLLFSCSGFTVISSDGSLAYRVDNYTGRPDEVVLMDGSGSPIFTVCRRKKLRLLEKHWVAYEGEVSKYSSKKKLPVFCARREKAGVAVYEKKRCVYVVEGSYRHRSCKILDGSRRVVGEIKRKEAMAGGASFGLEVFHLIVKPGFDSAFAMAFVLFLHQMFT